MHINLVTGDFIVGYSKEDYTKYKNIVKDLLNNDYILKEKEYQMNGDLKEYFYKGEDEFIITHLAI